MTPALQYYSTCTWFSIIPGDPLNWRACVCNHYVKDQGFSSTWSSYVRVSAQVRRVLVTLFPTSSTKVFSMFPSHSAYLSVSVESFSCRIPAGCALCPLIGWWGCFQWKRTQPEPLGPLLPSHMTGRFWCRWQICQRPEQSSTPFQTQAEPYCCATDVFDGLCANIRKLDAGVLFVSLCRESVWAC